jgi:hypothetical protein
MSREVVDAFAWVRPHLAALESDFSVFHRVDDMYAMPVGQWARRLSQLPAYGGAFAIAMQEQGPLPKPGPAPAQGADGEMSEAQVKARFRQILIETYPEQAADGIREISADQMLREAGR